MKYLAIVEIDCIRLIKLKKGTRPMITRQGRLYRADDSLFIADYESSDAMLIYRIDSTQPILCRPKIVDPDITRAYIASAKLAGNKKKSWLNLDGGKTWNYLTAIAIVGSIIYGFMIGGGI